MLTSSSYSIKSNFVNSPCATLSAIPFPTVYVTVNVVFEGSMSTSILLRNPANPFPTLSGFGTISSSLLSDTPAPNCNSKRLSLRNLVINRFDDFLNFNKLGDDDLYATKSGSFSKRLGIASNTVSCAKYGTSYQLSPSDSVSDITSIIFVSGNTTLSYAIGLLNVNLDVFTSPDTALAIFFKR